MINQVSNTTDKSVFTPLQSNGAAYAVSKPFTQEQLQEREKDKERRRNFGYNLGKAALFTGFGVLLISKGLPKNARAKVNEVLKNLEEKLSSMNKAGETSGVKGLAYKALNGAKSLTKYTKSLFNFAPLKDVVLKEFVENEKVVKKAPFLKTACDAVSKFFEKISVKVANGYYKKNLGHFDEMCAGFASANEQIMRTKPNLSEELKKGITTLREEYTKAFSEESRNKRFLSAKEGMKEIYQQFWNETYGQPLKFLRNPKSTTTFISEELAAPTKMKLNFDVSELKKVLTISVEDNYTAGKKLLSQIDAFVKIEDPTLRPMLKEARANLEAYKKAHKIDGDAENAVLNAFESIRKGLSESHYEQSSVKQALENIDGLKGTLGKKGDIQRLIHIYEQNLPHDDFVKLEKSVNKTLNSLNKATDIETDRLFDKIRDIQIGSAPMDVLSIISSLGVVSWWLGKADNKDERISAALKYGIPAIGSVTVSLFCTLALISGGPALGIGLLSGFAINRLGVMIDKARKKYEKEPPTQMDASQILPNLKKHLDG